jgi:hypothetical protein
MVRDEASQLAATVEIAPSQLNAAIGEGKFSGIENGASAVDPTRVE